MIANDLMENESHDTLKQLVRVSHLDHLKIRQPYDEHRIIRPLSHLVRSENFLCELCILNKYPTEQLSCACLTTFEKIGFPSFSQALNLLHLIHLNYFCSYFLLLALTAPNCCTKHGGIMWQFQAKN